MLRKLIINNFATINHLEIDFSSGFSVLTGETGSGKSIIIGALNLISGSRADFSKLNDKTKKIVIEAEFDISNFDFSNFLNYNNIDNEEDLIIRREVLPNGKSRSFINDTPVRLELLKNFSLKIIDVHSQHENLLLNDEFFQLNFLDSLLVIQNPKFSEDLKNYQKKFSENQLLSQKIDQFHLNTRLQKEEFDNLSFLLSELKNANLKIGEKKQALEDYNLLNNIFEIKKSLNKIANFFQTENGVISNLEKSSSLLNSISNFNEKLVHFNDRLLSNLIDLKDLNEEINLFQDRLNINQNKLEELTGRLNLINSLEEKHLVSSVEQLLQRQEDLSKKVSFFESSKKDISTFQKDFNENNEWLLHKSNSISKLRRDFSKKIESKLIQDLQQLGIHDAKIQFVFKDLDSFNYYGKDSLELLFSANKGHDLKAIQKVASGGELSRLMLCIKKHLYLVKKSSTVIFDEIDSGVSGEIAEKVGFFMKEISEKQQIIAITHLPQIASIANDHYKVFKNEFESEKTETKIHLLDRKKRVIELARLLSGEEITNEAIANAEKMLNI